MMNDFYGGYALGQNNNNGGLFGGNGDGLGALALLALLFGWGGNNGGWGNNGNNNSYHLGQLATTNDVASGFSTSAIMSNQRDIQLSQQQGFSDVQQTLCQGFSGVNQTVNTVGNQINQGICNLGYTLQGNVNSISREIGDCCCKTQRAIDSVNFNAERNTANIIQSNTMNTQRILDYLCDKENQNLRDENFALRLAASQEKQNNYLIDSLRPTARPAYITCSPYESVYGCKNNNCCGYNGL